MLELHAAEQKQQHMHWMGCYGVQGICAIGRHVWEDNHE